MAISEKSARTPTEKGMVELLAAAHDTARDWLEIYQDLRIKLAKLASDKLTAGGGPGSPIISTGEELELHLRSFVPEGG